jgi:ribosomal RNA-processing protein 12
MVESDEEDSDDGRTLATGATGFTKMTGRSVKSSQTSKGEKSLSSKTKKSMASGSVASSGRKQLPAIQLPDETDGEVIDMLGASMAKKVKFMEQEDLDDDSGSEAAMEFDDEGRLVIHDEPSEDRKADSAGEGANKKQRTSKFESAKISRSNKKETGRRNPKQLGAAYKSKKAGGDVKRKDQKYEPYAFVPLDGKSYSKKNRRSAVETMSTVVRQGKKRKGS